MIEVNATHYAEVLQLEKVGKGEIKLTAIFSDRIQTSAVVSKSDFLNALKGGGNTDFSRSNLRRVSDFNDGEVRIFFLPNEDDEELDLIVVLKKELKRAIERVR